MILLYAMLRATRHKGAKSKGQFVTEKLVGKLVSQKHDKSGKHNIKQFCHYKVGTEYEIEDCQSPGIAYGSESCGKSRPSGVIGINSV